MKSMDTSKFSLEKATELVRPHLDYLSFKQFDVHEQDLRTSQNYGSELILKFYPANMMFQGSLMRKPWIYPFPLMNVLMDISGGKVVAVNCGQFFLTREGSSITWFQKQMRFTPEFDHNPTSFALRKGTMEKADTSVDFSPEFEVQFRSCLVKWIDDSMAVRQEAINSLRELRLKLKPGPA